MISTDEKTGIQAIERNHAALPTRPGLEERMEFDYTRHGTRCLIANLEVATGQLVSPTLGPTRTEGDFVRHIETTIETDPDAEWIFVMDQLNTHKSASLVEMVSRRCELKEDLGKKEVSGVLKSLVSRRAFLEDLTHRIRIVYTPRHASWLNQIEIWFSILARRVLKRGSFSSLEVLEERLRAFISYFNCILARPFKWTYQGHPLRV